MPAFLKPDSASGPVCALCHGVPMNSESVGFDVNISGTVSRIPRMMISA